MAWGCTHICTSTVTAFQEAVLKHFVYIQYGCGIHSKGGCILYHHTQQPNLVLSQHTPTPNLKMHPPITSTPVLHMYYGIRVHPYPYCVHPQHIKVLKHFVYIQYGCGIKSKACCSLNNDITTSFRLRFTPKIHPWPAQAYHCEGVAPYAHTHHNMKVPK